MKHHMPKQIAKYRDFLDSRISSIFGVALGFACAMPEHAQLIAMVGVLFGGTAIAHGRAEFFPSFWDKPAKKKKVSYKKSINKYLGIFSWWMFAPRYTITTLFLGLIAIGAIKL